MDFTTLGVQAVAAAAAVGVLWLAARKDSRDARTEFQRSIETLMAPRLEILDGKIEALDGKIDTKLEAFKVKIDTKLEAFEEKIDTKLEALEGKIDGGLKALDGKIDGIRTENADIKVRLNAIEEHLRQRRVK